MGRYIPRSDVGGGLIVSALSVVIMAVLDRARVFDFNEAVAAVTALVVFAAGYAPERYKSFLVAAAAFAAYALVSAYSAWQGLGYDHAGLSTAIAGLVFAAVTYLGPPRSPERPAVIAEPTTVPRQRQG